MSNGKEKGGLVWTVPTGLEGSRLDAALAEVMPELGLRARRRLWDCGRILLDGKAAKPGSPVRAGQLLTIVPADPGGDTSRYALKPCFVKEQDGFVFLAKPAGLPSAAIAGQPGLSAESFLREEWADLRAEYSPHILPENPPLLCNRLDTATSGLLTAAVCERGVKDFRAWESSGRTLKLYFALVRGVVKDEMTITRAIDAAKRKKSLVLDVDDPDEARHSHVLPLRAVFEGGRTESDALTLVRVLIKRGARHQIRAHLAWAGHPIVGDGLYGDVRSEDSGLESGSLLLHHAAIKLPVAEASLTPPWTLWPELSSGLNLEDILSL